MVPFLLLIVVIVAVGVGVLAVRNRSDQGIESGISSFRREMHALAPRRGAERPPADEPAPPRREPDPGVHVIDKREPDAQTVEAESPSADEDAPEDGAGPAPDEAT